LYLLFLLGVRCPNLFFCAEDALNCAIAARPAKMV
jgi:hypothetical protein